MWPGSGRNPIYPPRCLLCGAAGQADLDLCPDCAAELPANPNACRHCALPLPLPAALADPVCGGCLKHPPAQDRSYAPFRYRSPIDHLLTRFKYQGSLAHGRLLADLFTWALRESGTPLPDLIVPAPMHAERLRERGMNQAAELARQVSQGLAIPWRADILTKTRPTGTQRGLSRRERRRNLRGSFDCQAHLPWRHVALLDDVVTTGATADEMARTLRRAGVREISVWAIARTPEQG